MTSQQTVQKIANVAYILLKVLMIIMFVCAGITAASAVLVLTVSATSMAAEIINPVLVEFEVGLTIFQTGILLIADTIIILSEAIVFMYGKNYFKGICDDGTPFTHRGAEELKFLGIRLMAFPFGAFIISSILCAIFGVTSESQATLNVGLGVACILLSFVMHHGAELKEKADMADSIVQGANKAPDESDVF